MTIYPFTSQTTRPRKTPDQRGVTGRDSYIIAECLIRYIMTEQAKPVRTRSWSNLQDVKAIFNAYCGAKNAVFFEDHYPGQTIDLIDEKAPRNHSD
jgi:hypothetical protein